ALLKSATEQSRRNSCDSQPRNNDITFWANKIEIIDPSARNRRHWIIRGAGATLLRTSRGEPSVSRQARANRVTRYPFPSQPGSRVARIERVRARTGHRQKKCRGFPRQGFRGHDGPRSWRNETALGEDDLDAPVLGFAYAVRRRHPKVVLA